MSALGQKQTSEHVRALSALPPKTDIGTGMCISFDVGTPATWRYAPQSAAPGLAKRVVKLRLIEVSGLGLWGESRWTLQQQQLAEKSLPQTAISEVGNAAEKQANKPAQIANSKIGIDAERIRSSISRLTSNSTDELEPTTVQGGDANRPGV